MPLRERVRGGAGEVPGIMEPTAGQAEAAVTLVDIGGTKELVLVVGVDGRGGLIGDAVFARREIKTPIGKVGSFYDATVDAVHEAQAKSRGIRLLPLVCVGTPGRLVDGVIQPGSAANLGDKRHEFDGVNPARELEARLRVKVNVVNDAIAQMGFGLKALFESGKAGELRGRKVCYVGPGTGLGGGFCQVRDDLSLDIYTDGHIYDIMLPGFDGRVHMKFKCDGAVYEARLPYERAKAEDLLSGRAVRQLACAMDRELLLGGVKPLFLPLALGRWPVPVSEASALLDHDNEKSPLDARFLREGVLEADGSKADVERARPQARQIFEFEGGMLGRLVECVYNGSVSKYSHEAQWPGRDRRLVSGTVDYVIGGSVGTRGAGGAIIRAKATEYLDGSVPGVGFNFHPIDPGVVDTANAGALGTYMFADRALVLDELARLKRL